MRQTRKLQRKTRYRKNKPQKFSKNKPQKRTKRTKRTKNRKLYGGETDLDGYTNLGSATKKPSSIVGLRKTKSFHIRIAPDGWSRVEIKYCGIGSSEDKKELNNICVSENENLIKKSAQFDQINITDNEYIFNNLRIIRDKTSEFEKKLYNFFSSQSESYSNKLESQVKRGKANAKILAEVMSKTNRQLIIS